MFKRNFKCLVISLLLPVFQVFSSPLVIDGGGRREISPYQPNSLVTVAKVSSQKRISDSSMTLTLNNEQCVNVGIAYIRNNQNGERVSHRLIGITDNGERTSIDFSMIERISILRVAESPTAKKAYLMVDAFPVISPAELVSKRPTYSELESKYRRTYKLWVEIKNNSGSLSLITTPDQNICRKFEDIPVGAEMFVAPNDLRPVSSRGTTKYWAGEGKGLWWAIPSVIGDTKYPYIRPAARS